jgi:hypothetical protein
VSARASSRATLPPLQFSSLFFRRRSCDKNLGGGGVYPTPASHDTPHHHTATIKTHINQTYLPPPSFARDRRVHTARLIQLVADLSLRNTRDGPQLIRRSVVQDNCTSTAPTTRPSSLPKPRATEQLGAQRVREERHAHYYSLVHPLPSGMNSTRALIAPDSTELRLSSLFCE